MNAMTRWVFAGMCLFVLLETSSWAQQPAPGVAVSSLENRRILQNRLEIKRRDIVNKLAFLSSSDPNSCVVPPRSDAADIDPHRSLFVHDRPTLDARDFSLRRTLQQFADQANVTGLTPEAIFRQFWDTQNPSVPGATGPRCDDNGGEVNGFPNSCRPGGEGQEAGGTNVQVAARMDAYRVISLVNRIDLAHEGWRNCGEFRIIYGKPESGIERNLIIFEAVLPNPKPGCREGCLEVAKFWRSLTQIDSPALRAAELEKFYYGIDGVGLPGYRPVVHIDHYSSKGVTGSYGASGSGQIRTNQFLQQPWVLKEFKTVLDCGAQPCKFEIVPIMVKVNPFGTLWNEDVAANAGPKQLLAQDFQSDILANIDKLADARLGGIGYPVDLSHDAAQSFSQLTAGAVDHYRNQFHAATGPTNNFRNDLDVAAAAQGLTADQVVNRALTQSCAGCHKPDTFGLSAPNSIGPVILPDGTLGTSWPDALSFVHVDTLVSSRPELASVSGHALSPALNDAFLPARKQFLLTQLNSSECACRNRFPFLRGSALIQALRVQARVERQFVPRVQTLTKELVSPPIATTLAAPDHAASDKKIRALRDDRDKALRAELRRNGIALPVESLRAQPLRLNSAAQARGNPARERALRQAEVLKIVKEEPPRRTVTGSFTVH